MPLPNINPDNTTNGPEFKAIRCYECGAPLLEEDGNSPSCGPCVDIARRLESLDVQDAYIDSFYEDM